MSLSSPNRIIWCYFRALRRLAQLASESEGNEEVKEMVAMCILLAITVVEAFLNVFFRVVVSEGEFSAHKQRVLRDIDQRRSLDYKIRKWPAVILGQTIDWKCGIGREFMVLKGLRNELNTFHELTFED